MGLFSRISNWWNQTGSKAYNAIRNGVSTGYQTIKNVAHTIGAVSNGIDNLVNQAKTLPIVGYAAQALQAHPIYQEIRGGINAGVNAVDEVGKAGTAIDSAIKSAGG